ncbi:MAG: 50S ribosomal protein L19, partial [Bdellovibrionales bacterium]|nr:50S ribosomal protein L19 [Bdellovibrionales bacterium]
MDFISRITLKRAQEKNWIKKFEDFKSGDTVKVYVRIKEGEKERVQIYKGVCIKIQGSGLGKSFTVRKMSSGVGVERTFPFSSPKLEKVEIVSRGIVRRSRLYYLRDLVGRAARLNTELMVSEDGSGADESSDIEQDLSSEV